MLKSVDQMVAVAKMATEQAKQMKDAGIRDSMATNALIASMSFVAADICERLDKLIDVSIHHRIEVEATLNKPLGPVSDPPDPIKCQHLSVGSDGQCYGCGAFPTTVDDRVDESLSEFVDGDPDEEHVRDWRDGTFREALGDATGGIFNALIQRLEKQLREKDKELGRCERQLEAIRAKFMQPDDYDLY